MCITLCNTHNLIPKKVLKTCSDNNPNGMGMLYVSKSGKLTSFKEMNNFDSFYKAYKFIRSTTKLPIILHFRIATHGKVNIDNAHPFFVNENLGFTHNGILDIETPQKDYSDTWHFNEFLKGLPENFIENEAIKVLLTNIITWSKIIFMDNNGNVTILNEEEGEMYKGDWYSNGTYKETNYYNVGGKNVQKYLYNNNDLDDYYGSEEDKWGLSYNKSVYSV